jgi:hypothetical protein
MYKLKKVEKENTTGGLFHLQYEMVIGCWVVG